ncbi:MAG: hypothetical protein QP830_07430 [Actinotignum sanguinis]|uniref:hypothetical protein n=1 Tax=Actinotignum sanguinis TaxID=1445614 RepID=UPI00237D63A7|nr:hypothetical protein [Actinotignum sanguinis]MDE1552539.1 hypothetical protein [Actinotignum sanguinis]MDE1566088.1 hypothetical protein [Actinotignum sanguinis]MDE1576954.1 hypothetical protein [Actinotignum sanguinis]MDE1641997.1 hypothetical protein [Actinotignum sanguinis]MDK8287099.1 hypothetical protein [Actinotignum sanguinis]
MRRIFDPDSPFQRGLSDAVILVELNIMTLLGLLPVVSGGASLVASARVSAQLLRGEAPRPWRLWWQHVRAAFLPSLAWWLPTLGLFGLAWWENRWLSGLAGPTLAADPRLAGILSGLIIVALLLVLAVLVWLVTLQAFFSNAFLEHLGNAVLLAITRPLRTAACVAAAVALPLAWLYAPVSRLAIFWALALAGLSVPLYLTAWLQRPVLDGLLTEAEG